MPYFDDEEDFERIELYRLFARLFMEEPTDEVYIQVADVFQMKPDETLDKIITDFATLFLGPVEHILPYESIYQYPYGDRPRLWGKAAEEVQGFYDMAELVFEEDTSLIPDHISVELLFMSYLIENGIADLQEGFLEDHLIKWVPALCDDIYKRAHTAFYKEVANLLKEFILSEGELVS